LTDSKIANKEKDYQKRKELQAKEIELTQRTAEMIHAFINRGIEQEKNANAEKLNEIENKKATEIKAVEESTLSEQQKAIEIRKINLQSQLDKEDLMQRQKKLDYEKAKNDKLAAIFGIILNTAMNVAKNSWNPPLAIITAAIGATELATAISTPLPKYEKGRKSGKGEFALTDEKGAEGYLTKDGRFSIGSNKGANVKYLEPGERVIPAGAELNEFMLKAMYKSNSFDYREHAKKDTSFNQMSGLIQWQTMELKEAFKKNKSRVTVNINGISDHIKQQIYR
jgi:hypothetical protein